MAERSTDRAQLIRTSTLGVGVVLAIALALIVNYFGWKYHQRFDWTTSRLYSLSEKSSDILEALDEPVEIIAFVDPADKLFTAVRELLARYEAASPQVTVRFVDPVKNRLEAEQLIKENQLDRANVIVVRRGEERRVVEGTDLAEYDYSGMQFGQAPRMTAFKGEQLVTSAILELVESRKPKVELTTGHGEARLDDFSTRGLSSVRELLGEDNVELEEWKSLAQPRVPEGTDLVAILGPTSRFIEPELAALREYLQQGGRLLVLLDPTFPRLGTGLVETGLEGLLAEYGVAVGDDIVIDPSNPVPFFGPESIFVQSYGDHAITRSLRQAQLSVILPLSRSVRRGEVPEGLEVTELLRTTSDGWAEADLAALPAVEPGGAGDLAGPVSLAVAVAAKPKAEASEAADDEDGEPAAAEESGGEETVASAPGLRIVVVGDSDFATNGQVANAANGVLLANTLNWLVERETLLGIPPKRPEQVKLNLTRDQARRITWLVLGVLPGLAILLGVGVHLRRRR